MGPHYMPASKDHRAIPRQTPPFPPTMTLPPSRLVAKSIAGVFIPLLLIRILFRIIRWWVLLPEVVRLVPITRARTLTELLARLVLASRAEGTRLALVVLSNRVWVVPRVPLVLLLLRITPASLQVRTLPVLPRCRLP